MTSKVGTRWAQSRPCKTWGEERFFEGGHLHHCILHSCVARFFSDNCQSLFLRFFSSYLAATSVELRVFVLLIANQCVYYCFWCSAAAVEGKNVRSSEEVLLNYLFDGYNPTARPVFNSSLTVAVNLRFSLLQIQDLVVVDYHRHHHHVYYS